MRPLRVVASFEPAFQGLSTLLAQMSSSGEADRMLATADFAPKRDSFPMSIVWSVIPGLTWLLPPVGHMGVCASDGTVYDFAGPYYIHANKKQTAFGPVN